jgi:hypothetical protein
MGMKHCLILREERGCRVFGNRVLRRIYGPKREEVAGCWRRLHNEELHNLYASPHIIIAIKLRRMRWSGNVVASMGKMRNAYKTLFGIPEWKRPLGRPSHGWESNIRMDIREIGWEVVHIWLSVGTSGELL